MESKQKSDKINHSPIGGVGVQFDFFSARAIVCVSLTLGLGKEASIYLARADHQSVS